MTQPKALSLPTAAQTPSGQFPVAQASFGQASPAQTTFEVDASATVAQVVALLNESPTGRVRVRGLMPASDVEEQPGGNGGATELMLVSDDMQTELRAAREVQMRLLPRGVPTVPGFDFAGRYSPAGDIGGDYWSVKYYREENIVTCKLADVTGHGMAAAILVAAVKFVSGVLFRYSSSPSVVMERTNHSLLRETAPDRMATMVYAWIYPETGRVRLVNAGHAPAFVCRASGTVEDIAATGPLLGLMDTHYDELVLHLAPGDLLFICSDGISEAGDVVQFGEERIKEIVRESRHERADAIADRVFAAAHACCGKVRDDMALFIAKSTGPVATGEIPLHRRQVIRRRHS